MGRAAGKAGWVEKEDLKEDLAVELVARAA